MAAAIHTLDTLIQPTNPQRSLEATVMLASLRAHPRPGVSSSDVAQERARARELFDRVSKGAKPRLLESGISKAIEHAELVHKSTGGVVGSRKAARPVTSACAS